MTLTLNYWPLERGVHNNPVLDLTDASNADSDSDCVIPGIMPGDTDHVSGVSPECL